MGTTLHISSPRDPYISGNLQPNMRYYILGPLLAMDSPPLHSIHIPHSRYRVQVVLLVQVTRQLAWRLMSPQETGQRLHCVRFSWVTPFISLQQITYLEASSIAFTIAGVKEDTPRIFSRFTKNVGVPSMPYFKPSLMSLVI
jgi:hypothetical protein